MVLHVISQNAFVKRTILKVKMFAKCLQLMPSVKYKPLMQIRFIKQLLQIIKKQLIRMFWKDQNNIL